VRKGDDLTTFIVPKVEKIRTLTYRIPKDLLRPVAGKIYLTCKERHENTKHILFQKYLEQSRYVAYKKFNKCPSAGQLIIQQGEISQHRLPKM
jgi:hypothetical protein